MQNPNLPSGTSKREIDVIQCPACHCAWKGGIGPDAQRYCEALVHIGWGLVLVPDCPGCPCHTGVGVLPPLKVSFRWLKKND